MERSIHDALCVVKRGQWKLTIHLLGELCYINSMSVHACPQIFQIFLEYWDISGLLGSLGLSMDGMSENG